MFRHPLCSLVLLLVLPALVTTAPAQDDPSLYVTPENLPVRSLDVRPSFEALSPTEKQYAHWMSMASWHGALITFEQLSAESPRLLELILRIYDKNRVELRKTCHWYGVSDEALGHLERYAARVLSNCGNYLSFGDTKFLPAISEGDFGLVVRAAAGLDGDERLIELFEDTRADIYSLAPDVRALGLGAEGISRYYSDDITREDVDLITAFMAEQGMEAWNTRLVTGPGGELRIKVASALHQPERRFDFKGRVVVVEYGDFAPILERVVQYFGRALPFAANENQRRMILAYIAHFNGGDIDDHKASQRWWVKDKGPVVETNIGFIETYRDPVSQRAEWEGLVSIVNKEQTEKFGRLVKKAPDFIPLLPWGRAFEKDKFLRPDFTSLEVLAFANSGIPSGINIPNYDDIRQRDGFKNVSLGNVIRSGGAGKSRITLLSEADEAMYRAHSDSAYEVQVGLHELLGHGTGKLLEQMADGSFNFDREKVVSSVDGKPVSTWYKPGETWGSVFSDIASSYEECRAEAVGLHLSTNDDVLAIFGAEGEKAGDVMYTNWVSMARAGVVGLLFYDPKGAKWRQAHMQARFALLQVMLEAGKGFLSLNKKDGGDWEIALDRSKIKSVGAPAVAEYLKKLNVYKATADVKAGRDLYRKYTSVSKDFLEIRSWLQSKRKPRHVWVQPVTDVNVNGEVVLREYPATYLGVIDSFLDRYSFLID